jgi:hypothetical protein
MYIRLELHVIYNYIITGRVYEPGKYRVVHYMR